MTTEAVLATHLLDRQPNCHSGYTLPPLLPSPTPLDHLFHTSRRVAMPTVLVRTIARFYNCQTDSRIVFVCIFRVSKGLFVVAYLLLPVALLCLLNLFSITCTIQVYTSSLDKRRKDVTE